MPHRVTNFFRSSNDNLSIRSARSTTSQSNSDSDDAAPAYAVKNPNPSPALRNRKPSHSEHSPRKSHTKLFGKLAPGASSAASKESAGAAIDCKIESPPIIFFGNAEESTGALVSGQLFLRVLRDGFEMDKFAASLKVKVLQKKPFQGHCGECAAQVTELKSWEFLTHSATLSKGEHQFPFSVLLPGHLPASMDTPLVSINYEFKAELVPRAAVPGQTVTPLRLERSLVVRRSLPECDLPRHSQRVFPPTKITADAHYTQVIHPTGSGTLTMRLSGLSHTNPETNTIEIWRVKRLTWRLEEQIKTIAPACTKHDPNAGESDGATAPRGRKGISRTEIRTLGEKTLHDGWKSSYTPGTSGEAEIEVPFGVTVHHKHHHSSSMVPTPMPSQKSLKGQPKCACDSRSRDGTEVTHQLVVEAVVSKEWAPVGRPNLASQTGTGRVLRMGWGVVLTESVGEGGVSWDEEAPPIYGDVPPSPPGYEDMARELGVMGIGDVEVLTCEPVR